MNISHTKAIAYNTMVQVIARVITTLASLVAIGYLTRYLGVEGYGQFALIFAYLSLFGVLADFGFFLLQVRETTKHPSREAEIVGNILGLKIVLSVVVFVVAYLVAVLVYNNPLIIAGVLIGSIAQAAMILAQVPTSLFQAHLQMQKVAVINVVARLLYLGLIIWGVNYGIGLLGMVGITAVANVLAFVLFMLMAGSIVWIVPRWDFNYWWEFLAKAWPIGVVVTLAIIYFQIDTVMLSIMKSDWEVGIYGAPYKVIGVALTLPTIFMSSVFPVMTRALSSSWQKARQIFRRAFDFLGLIALPLGFGVLIVGTPVMLLIAGSDFIASGLVLKLLIWAAVISFFGGVLNYTIIAAGKQRILVWPYLVATVFNVVTNLLVIPHYSYIGAAVTTIATELLVFIYVAVVIYRELRFSPSLKVFGKALVGAVVMAGVLYFVGSDNLWLNVGLGTIVYAGIILLTRAIDKNIFRELLRPS